MLRPSGDPLDESFAAVYSTARCNHAADGWRDSGGVSGVPAAAGFGAPSGGLPHNSGCDVLSRWKPRGNGLLGDRAARAQLWADSRLAPDDLDELFRLFGHHVAIQSRFEY